MDFLGAAAAALAIDGGAVAKPISFTFIPRLPTKKAYDERKFGNFSSVESFFGWIKHYEKSLGNSKYLSGEIHFKKGFYSTYKDGSESRPYNNPKWWLTGAKTCLKGCCTEIPEGEVASCCEPKAFVPIPWQKDWQEFKRIRGPGGAEEQFMGIKNKEQISRIVITGHGRFNLQVI